MTWTKEEIKAFEKVLNFLFPAGNRKHILQYIFWNKKLWHYLGARVCYYNKGDILDLYLDAEVKNTNEPYNIFNFVVNLIYNGHTSITGTTYTYFIVPDSHVITKSLLKLPYGAARVDEIDKNFDLIIISDRAFAEYIRNAYKKDEFLNLNNINICEYYKNIPTYWVGDLFTYLSNVLNDIFNSDAFTNFERYQHNLEDIYNKELIQKLKGKKWITEKFYNPIVYKISPTIKNHSSCEFEYMNLFFIRIPNYYRISKSSDEYKLALAEKIRKWQNQFFIIEKTDKVTTHQIVRHKTLNFLQRSDRYTKTRKSEVIILMDEINYANPEWKVDTLVSYFDGLITDKWSRILKYENKLKRGFKKEAARDELQQFKSTNIVIAGLRRFIEDFINERIKPDAQNHIRVIAKAMDNLII